MVVLNLVPKADGIIFFNTYSKVDCPVATKPLSALLRLAKGIDASTKAMCKMVVSLARRDLAVTPTLNVYPPVAEVVGFEIVSSASASFNVLILNMLVPHSEKYFF